MLSYSSPTFGFEYKAFFILNGVVLIILLKRHFLKCLKVSECF